MLKHLQANCSIAFDDGAIWETDLSFTRDIMKFPLPDKFKVPQLDLCGESKDPTDHIEIYQTYMGLSGAPNQIMRRVFQVTLVSPTQMWFGSLKPNYVS